MSREGLQTIIGIAIVDQKFRELLLADPLEAVEAFYLSNEERTAISSIKAKSLEQFAARLELWLSKAPVKPISKQRPAPPWGNELLRLAG